MFNIACFYDAKFSKYLLILPRKVFIETYVIGFTKRRLGVKRSTLSQLVCILSSVCMLIVVTSCKSRPLFSSRQTLKLTCCVLLFLSTYANCHYLAGRLLGWTEQVMQVWHVVFHNCRTYGMTLLVWQLQVA